MSHMVRQSIPKVLDDQLMLPNHADQSFLAIQVGSEAWFAWLDEPTTRSFAFHSPQGTLTARREHQHATWFWYAYRSERATPTKSTSASPGNSPWCGCIQPLPCCQRRAQRASSHMARSLLLLARLRAQDALTELRAPDLRFTFEETTAFLTEVMGLPLSAQPVAALQAQGDPAEALTALGRALVLAEPEGYIRLFLDEGTAMVALLRQAHKL